MKELDKIEKIGNEVADVLGKKYLVHKVDAPSASGIEVKEKGYYFNKYFFPIRKSRLYSFEKCVFLMRNDNGIFRNNGFYKVEEGASKAPLIITNDEVTSEFIARRLEDYFRDMNVLGYYFKGADSICHSNYLCDEEMYKLTFRCFVVDKDDVQDLTQKPHKCVSPDGAMFKDESVIVHPRSGKKEKKGGVRCLKDGNLS